MAQSITWTEIIKRFENYLKLERSLSENSVAAYIADITKLKQFAQQQPSPLTVTRIGTVDLQNFLVFLNDLGIQPRSQARIISGIKAFFKFLLFDEIRELDPAALLEGPKLGRRLPDTLSYEEIEKIIQAIDHSTPQGARDRAVVETLYSSGLRVSELRGLKNGDIHFDVGFLRIRGKGNKERLVPIGTSAMKYLKIYIDQVRSSLAIKSGFETTVFLNLRGSKLSRVSVFNLIKDLVAKAGLTKNVSPHTFRHSFATHLIEGGADLRAVQQMLGHESITTTEIYTHLDRDYLRQVITEFHPRS